MIELMYFILHAETNTAASGNIQLQSTIPYNQVSFFFSLQLSLNWSLDIFGIHIACTDNKLSMYSFVA